MSTFCNPGVFLFVVVAIAGSLFCGYLLGKSGFFDEPKTEEEMMIMNANSAQELKSLLAPAVKEIKQSEEDEKRKWEEWRTQQMNEVPSYVKKIMLKVKERSQEFRLTKDRYSNPFCEYRLRTTIEAAEAIQKELEKLGFEATYWVAEETVIVYEISVSMSFLWEE